MAIPQNIKAFFKIISIREMKGEEAFAAIVYFLSSGKKGTEIYCRDVKKNWSKTSVGKIYNPCFAYRAQGYIDPCGKGKVSITDEGIEYIEARIQKASATQAISAPKTMLIVFDNGTSHSFDKFLRNIFRSAKKNADIADTYVSGNIFDNLLDEIPKAVPIRFIYKKDTGGFVSRSGRFGVEYNFQSKISNGFHDRFILVDDVGYIIGPSLKDAADKKPATMVVLDSSDSKKLSKLFSSLW